MSRAAIGELQFLRKLQRLLAEGDFVATYNCSTSSPSLTAVEPRVMALATRVLSVAAS